MKGLFTAGLADRGVLAWCAGLSLCAAMGAAAASDVTIPDEYNNHIRERGSITASSGNVFGESVSLGSGSLEFVQTDVSLPGNNEVPVRVGRRFRLNRLSQGIGHFAYWDLDIPSVHGVFGPEGWVVQGSTLDDRAKRCANFSAPPAATFQGGVFMPDEFWSGTYFHVPGQGEQEVLRTRSTTSVPSDGHTYAVVTKSGAVARCPANGSAFEFVTPDGMVYTLDHLATRNMISLRKSSGTPDPFSALGAMAAGADMQPMVAVDYILPRVEAFLFPTKVSDRFGNTVTYTWSTTNPWQLLRIKADDGRQLDFTYADSTSPRITSVTDGTRTWRYGYALTGPGELVSVTGPDESSWTFDLMPLTRAAPHPLGVMCDDIATPSTAAVIGRMTSPSGATATFTVAPTLLGRSWVPRECISSENQYTREPYLFETMALTSKKFEGPGLPSGGLSWTYSYGAPNHCWDPNSGFVNAINPVICNSNSPTARIVTETAPDGAVTRYTYGNRFGKNEGLLLKAEQGWSGSSAMRTFVIDHVYADADPATLPYVPSNGISVRRMGDFDITSRRLPRRRVVTTQQGETFTWEVDNNCAGASYCFDAWARPIRVKKFSSLSPSYAKTETTTYHDNLSKWVLGQVETVSIDGTQVARTDYTPTYALPLRTYSFGKLQQTLGYTTTSGDQNGTLRTIKDGRNNVTTLTSWKRGIPQSIGYFDGTARSAVVNADGTIASVTDENSFTTSYKYDDMGRLEQTIYPTGDSPAWASLTQSFTQVMAPEHGIPSGHWRQSTLQGNYRKNVFFDALWRPVLVHEYDAADVAGTLRSTRFNYDHEGRTTFASYVGGTTTAPDVGVHTNYDALGRVTRTEQDAEPGVQVVTTNEYLSGFQQRVTNPRNKATLFHYEAYDQPTTDMPERIVQPEGAYTYITRNAFGNPTQIIRRNSTGSIAVGRYYVYDAHQQLCKRLEPETGATVMDYDAAGNLAWSAGGQDLPSTTACDTAGVATAARVTRGYDARNRLESLSFFDGNGNQLWDYTDDGLPEKIITYNNEGSTAAVNFYTYNKRRLLTGESLAQGSQYSWGVGYGYDSLGHLARHTYPHGLTIDYTPNALGQPSKAGTYATGVDYYPNGAIAGFTYGNGIVHTLKQNERGLPERSRDAYGDTPVHDDSYDYDPNGNVLAISDGRPGAHGNRDMTYDDLDRLESTTSPMFSPAIYTYDVLDNLQTVKVAGRDHSYHYLNQQLINVKNVPNGASVIGLGYDAQGNLANKNGVLYDFDYGNRLREVVGKESYRYDGHGRRIQATLPTGGGNIYSMYGSDGVLRYQEDYRQGEATNYVYLGGSLVAEVANAKQTTTTPVMTAPASSNSGSYTVSWTASSGATRYVLDESINGGNWLQIKEGAGTSWSVTGKTDSSYSYRVRACDMECSGYSNIATVTVALIPQGVPALSAPAYDADGDFMVNWTAVPLGARYELLEQVNSGIWAQIKDTTDLFADITGKAPGIYGYRVRACNPNGCADWNAPGTVTVYVQVRPNQIPTLTVPQWGRNGDYTISWSASDGATKYVLEESIGPGWTIVPDTGSSLSWSALDRPAGTYSYRVAACNPAGCTDPSDPGSVETVYAPTLAPVITTPDQNTDGSFTVSWTAVAAGAKYRLEESFNNGSWVLIHNGTSRSYARTGKAAGTYRYRVKGCSVFDDCGPLSGTATTIEIDPPTGVPTLTAPDLVTNGSSYTVSWTAVSGATGYRLVESANGAAWTHVQSTANRSRAFSGKLAGSYRYQVRAYNDAGPGSYSPIKTTRMVYKPTSAPALTLPASSTTGSYTASWTAVATAIEYHLYERPVGGSWVRIHKSPSRSKAISGKGNGTYQYLLRAWNEGGSGPDAPVQSITVLKPPPVPGNLSVSQLSVWTCEVTWASASGASNYQLKMGTEVVYDGSAKWYTRPKCLTFFHVRACNASGCSAWSPPAYPTEGGLDPLSTEASE